MDYIVTTFTDESEALSAVFKNPESFHIAIVEVKTSSENESFEFLEAAKGLLPTIMISTVHCIATTMKCIALGAVEFLQKPLSLEKLKNIWQHVLHKAFNNGKSSVSESLKPVKESVVSMLLLDTDIATDEKDPAPSTPQLSQVSRLLDGEFQENIDCSMEIEDSSTEKENAEHQDIGESKSVDTSNHELIDDNVNVEDSEKEIEGKTIEHNEEQDGETRDPNREKTNSVNLQKEKDATKHVNKSLGIKHSSINKSNRKKVDWTPELHKKFVHAVEQLGVDQAIPSRILELMRVDGLTRHNVASHLQKYRMHRRSILPKGDPNHRQIQRPHNGHHVMAYPVWSVPGVYPQGAIQTSWPPPPPPQSSGPLHPWHWKPPYPPVHGSVWGCPVGPPVTFNTPNQNGCGFQSSGGAEVGFKKVQMGLTQDEELIEMWINEAINKPWLPLPLGLKEPCKEKLLAELARRRILTLRCSTSSCRISSSRAMKRKPCKN